MIKRVASRALALSVVVALGSASVRPVFAQTPAACADAIADGQVHLKKGKLLAAREKFTTCRAASCPADLRDDCNKFFDEVRTRVPTVILDARAGGQFVADASVAVDGAPFASKLDGKAAEIDPGPHTFIFTHPDGRTVTASTVIVESKFGQQVSVAFESTKSVEKAPLPPPVAEPTTSTGPLGAAPGTGPVSPPPTAPTANDRGASSASSTMRWIGVGIAGVGAIVGVTGTVVALRGTSKFNDANTACAGRLTTDPECAEGGSLFSEKADARSQRTLGITLAVVGGAALMGGIVLFAVSPSKPTESAALRVTRVAIAPTGLSIIGHF